MKLRLGFMSNNDMANWFGASVSSVANRKKRYLKELAEYARFDEVRGGVNVVEIYSDEYAGRNKQYNLVRDNIDEVWNSNGLDTCKKVSEKIKKKVELDLADSSVYSYTRKGRNELYGVPHGEPGSIGRCVYMLCKDTENGLEFFTEDEERIKRDIIKKYYGNIEERMVILDGMVLAGMLREEDYYKELHKYDGMNSGSKYMEFLGELQSELGCKVVKGTFKEVKELAWSGE